MPLSTTPTPTSRHTIYQPVNAQAACPICNRHAPNYYECFNPECDRNDSTPEVQTLPRFERVGTWSTAMPFDNDTTFERTRSERRFGIEIETQRCDNHRDLRNLLTWNCVNDGSVDGKEFVSVPMKGDNGLAQVDKLCEFARENNWRINSACGLHVHLDATDLTQEQLFTVARAYLLTYDLWSCFLPVSRKNNYYCAKHFYAPSSLDLYNGFEAWVREEVAGERYCWINFGAYLRHGTIELRNHTASLNARKINNWTRAHIRFIDAVKEMDLAEVLDKFSGTTLAEQFKHVSDTWGTNYLRRYYRDRATQFGYSVEAS